MSQRFTAEEIAGSVKDAGEILSTPGSLWKSPAEKKRTQNHQNMLEIVRQFQDDISDLQGRLETETQKSQKHLNESASDVSQALMRNSDIAGQLDQAKSVIADLKTALLQAEARHKEELERVISERDALFTREKISGLVHDVVYKDGQDTVGRIMRTLLRRVGYSDSEVHQLEDTWDKE